MARLCGVKDPDGAHWRASYNIIGELTSLTDPPGVSLHATTTAHQAQVTNAAGRVIAADQFDDYGRIVSRTDVFGATSSIDYNTAGLPAVLTDPLGAPTRFDYDQVGHLSAITSPSGLQERYSYDAAGRLASTTDPTGAVTRYLYDADSRLTGIIDPTGVATEYSWDPVGRLVETRAGEVVTFTADYDVCGRPTRTWDPVTGTRHFRYNTAGRLITAVDAAGQVHRYTWDKRGRLVTTTNAAALTTYRYNQLDQIVESTDPAGGTHRYTWNPAGRLTSHTGPDGITTSYDTRGGTETVTIDGQVSTRKWWDLEARQLHIDDHTDPAAPLHHTISVDARGLVCDHTTTDGDGKVIGRHHWDWDSEGRLTRADDTRATVSYTYRGDGLPTRITHSALGAASLAWDSAGRLTDVTTPDHHDHWDHDGGLVCGYVHDGRVTRVARDVQGRVTGIEGPSGRWSYGYNEAGSLISATGPRTQHNWTHDAYGRLTSHATSGTDTTFTWDQEGHLAQTCKRAHVHATATQYRYDAAGRRVSATSPDGQEERYSWDGRGWLSGITTDATTVSTHVDALGRASRITTGDQQVRVDWDLVTGAPTSIDGHPVLPLPGGRILGATPIGDTNLWREVMPTDPDNPYQPATVAIEGVPETIRMAGNTLVVDGHPWWGRASTTQLPPPPSYLLTR